VESDDLVHALQYLVKKFNTQITDYTPVVMQNLVGVFMNACSNPKSFDEPGSTAFLAAQQALATVITLLLGIKAKPNVRIFF
jgi:hypothetical protein